MNWAARVGPPTSMSPLNSAPYVHALRDGHTPDDPRIGPSATSGKDWLPGVHEWQLQQLAQRSERDATPG